MRYKIESINDCFLIFCIYWLNQYHEFDFAFYLKKGQKSIPVKRFDISQFLEERILYQFCTGYYLLLQTTIRPPFCTELKSTVSLLLFPAIHNHKYTVPKGLCKYTT